MPKVKIIGAHGLRGLATASITVPELACRPAEIYLEGRVHPEAVEDRFP
jgi:hypothetical protein